MVYLLLVLSMAAFAILVTQLEIPWLAVTFLLGAAIAAVLLDLPNTVALGLAALLFTLLAGRLCYQAFAEYVPVFQQLSKTQSSKLLLKSLWRWSPVLLVVALVFALIAWWNHSIQQAIYNIEASDEYACQDTRPGHFLVCQNEPEFEQNIYAFAERFGNTFASQRQDDVYAAIAQIEKTSGNLEQDLPRLIYQGGESDFNNGQPLYTAHLPASLTPPDCPKLIGWLTSPQQCLKHSLLQPLNSAYHNIRAESETALRNELNAMDDNLKGSSDAVKVAALRTINRSNQQYQSLSKKTLELLFLKNSLTTLLFYAFSLYLLLKILSYIVTRFAFDTQQGGTPLFLGNPELKPGSMNVQEFGNEVSLNLQDETWYATKHRKVRYAKKGRPVFPFPLRLLFRRLSTRTWAMYRFCAQDQSQQLELYANDVTHFILITLQPGDSLCFKLSNLVAFADTVMLKSRFSLKMSVFFRHSLFFTVATGPGKVLLRIDGGKGKVVIGNGEASSEKGFFDPGDLVAFDLNGRYSLHAQHDLLSVYAEGHSICPLQGTLAIRQVHDEKGVRSILASLKKLFTFLLPV